MPGSGIRFCKSVMEWLCKKKKKKASEAKAWLHKEESAIKTLENAMPGKASAKQKFLQIGA